MTVNGFHVDNAWQRQQRDRILAPNFYRRYSFDGRYVFMDKGRLAALLQKRYAVDTIMQKEDGETICIEEKIVRWPGYQYTKFCLETQSCTVPGRESDGWMCYGKADYLLYCFQQENGDLDSWLIAFPKLRDWFWAIEKELKQYGPVEAPNWTVGRLAPIPLVAKAVWTRQFMVRDPLRPASEQTEMFA